MTTQVITRLSPSFSNLLGKFNSAQWSTVENFIKNSPTLQQQIAQYDAAVLNGTALPIEKLPLGTNNNPTKGFFQVANSVGKISLGDYFFSTPGIFVAALSHEIGHFINQQTDAASLSAAIATKNVATITIACTGREGFAIRNNIIVIEEIETNKGVGLLVFGGKRGGSDLIKYKNDRLTELVGSGIPLAEANRRIDFELSQLNATNIYDRNTKDTYEKVCRDWAQKSPYVNNPPVSNSPPDSTTQTDENGVVTYEDSSGVSFTFNPINSEYSFNVPNDSLVGGSATYKREVAGESGYSVSEVVTNSVGDIAYKSIGYQESVAGDVLGIIEFLRQGGSVYSAVTMLSGKTVQLSAIDGADGAFKLTGVTAIDGVSISPGYLRDLLSQAFTEADLIEGFMVSPDGRSVLNQLVAAADPTSTTGGIQTLPTKPGVPWYDDENIKDALTEFSSLLGAIKSRNPEAIATAWIGAVSHRTQIPFINQISTSLSVLNGTKRLVDGIERGDLGAVAVSSGGLYTNYLTAELGALQAELAVAANLARTGRAQAIERAASLQSDVNAANAYLKDVGKALAFINLLIAIDKNDLNSAVISAAYFIPGYGPAISLALSIADMILGPLTSGNQTFESEGRFVGHPGGQITIEIGNHNGGANALWNVMAAGILDSAKKAAAADTTLLGQPMGVIAERLPLLILKRGVAVLSYTDALTGKQYSRTFDLQGNYLAPGYIEDIDAASPWGDNPANQFAKNKRDVNPADVQFHRCGASRPSINRVPCRLGGRTATRRQGSGKKFF